MTTWQKREEISLFYKAIIKAIIRYGLIRLRITRVECHPHGSSEGAESWVKAGEGGTRWTVTIKRKKRIGATPYIYSRKMVADGIKHTVCSHLLYIASPKLWPSTHANSFFFFFFFWRKSSSAEDRKKNQLLTSFHLLTDCLQLVQLWKKETQRSIVHHILQEIE